MHADYPLIAADDVPEGYEDAMILCIGCERPLPIGSPFAERPAEVDQDQALVTEYVCVYCDMGVPPTLGDYNLPPNASKREVT